MPESNTNKPHVLLFDDDPIYCRVMAKSGERLGFTVTTCTNTDQFCLEALKNEFDIALIDYHLGDYRGTQVSSVIEDKPVYLISNNQRIATMPSFFEASLKGFFSKTNSPEYIFEHVNKNI